MPNNLSFDPNVNKVLERQGIESINKLAEAYYEADKNIDKKSISLEDYKKKYISTIASINRDVVNVIDIANNSTTIMRTSGNKFKKDPLYVKLPGRETILDNIAATDFFDVVTGKKNTPEQLMKQTISLNYERANYKHGAPLGNIKKALANWEKSNQIMLFDLETIGGQDIYGRDTLDGLSEYTFKMFNKSGEAIQEFNSVIGISEDVAALYEQEVENMIKYGYDSPRARVLLNDLYKTGHKDTVINPIEGKSGLFKAAYTKSKFEDTLDWDTVRKGIEEKVKIGKMQETEGVVNGLKAYEQQLIDAMTIMANSDTLIGGQNIKEFDIPKLNRLMYTMSPKAREVLAKNLGTNNMFLDIPEERVLDTIELMRAINSTGNIGELYNTETLNMMRENKLTSMQQETLVRALFPNFYDSLKAHSSDVDVNAARNLFYEVSSALEGKSFIQKAIEVVNNMPTQNMINVIGNNKFLFQATESIYMNDYQLNNPMDFVQDSFTGKNRTFSGFSIGDIAEEDVKQFGIKRKGMYTVEDIAKLDLTTTSEDTEIMKQFRKIYPEYGQGSIFYMKLNPIYNKERIKGGNSYFTSPVYMFAKSRDELTNKLSSKFSLVGKNKGEYESGSVDNWEFINDTIAEEYRRYNIANKTFEAAPQIDEIINESTDHILNDSTARMFREDSYKTYSALSQLDEAIEKKMADGTIADKATALKMLYSDAQVKREIDSKVMSEQSKIAAEAVIKANNEAIKIPDIDLNEIFSYYFNGEKHKPYPEKLNKVMSGYEYFESQKKVIKPIIDYIKDNYDGSSNKEKDFIFSYLLNQTKETMSGYGEPGDEKEVSKRINNLENVILRKHDLDFFEIELPTNFSEMDRKGLLNTSYKAKSNDIENILRVNLNDEGWGLMNSLNRMSPNTTRIDKDEYSKVKMQELIEHIKEDPSIGKHFSDFTKNVNVGGQTKAVKNFMFKTSKGEMIDIRRMPAQQLSKEIINRLKIARNEDQTLGFVSDSNYMNVLKEAKYMDNVKYLEQSDIAGIIKTIDKTRPKYKILDPGGTAFDNEIDDIIKNILTPGYNEQDILNIAKRYGYSENKTKQLTRVYKTAESELKDFVTDFIKNVTSVEDTSVVYNAESKKIFAEQKGKAIALDQLLKIKEFGGTFYAQAGGNNIALYSFIDMDKSGTPEYTTTIKQASKKMFNLKHAFKKASDENRVLLQARSVTSYMNQMMSEHSAISSFHLSDRESNFIVDTSNIIKMIYQHKDSFRNANFRVPEVSKFIDKIVRLTEDGKLDYDNLLNNVSPADTSILSKDLEHIIKIFANLAPNTKNGVDLKQTLENTMFDLKDVQTVEFKGRIDGIVQDPFWEFNNYGRPVVNQLGRATQYRESDWKERVKRNLSRYYDEKDITKKVNFKNLLTENEQVKATSRIKLTNKQNSETAVHSVDLITANMSTDQYKYMLMQAETKEREKLAKGKSFFKTEKELESVYDILKSNNLFEQEEIIDSRVAETFFFRKDIQQVNEKKLINTQLEINQNTIDNMKAHEKLRPKFVMNKGKINVVFSKGEYVGRRDVLAITEGYGNVATSFGAKEIGGKLKFGYQHPNGIFATEKEIIDTIKEAGIDITKKFDTKTQTRVEELLANKYKAYYYVDPLFENNYFKIGHSRAEKGMANSVLIGLGRFDSNIEAALKKSTARLYGKIPVKDLIGTLPGYEMLGDIAPILAKELNISREEALKRLTKEKHAASEYLIDKVLGGLTKEKVSVIARQDIGKHESANIALRSLINFMVRDEESDKFLDDTVDINGVKKTFRDIFKGVEDKSQISFKSRISGGTLNLPRNIGEMDISVLNAFAEKKGLTWIDPNGNVRYGKALYDSDNMQIGNLTMMQTNQVEDNLRMGSKRNVDYDSKIETIEKALKQGLISKRAARYQINTLKDHMETAKHIEKGMKITGRDLLMLNFTKAHDVVDVLQDSVGKNISEDEFLDMAGHMLKTDELGNFIKDKKTNRYITNEEYVNRPILKDTVDNIRSQLFYRPGDRLLSDTDSVQGVSNKLVDNINSEEYKHLKDIFYAFNKDGDKIGTKAAELTYSFLHGKEAKEWNSGKLPMSAEEWVESRGTGTGKFERIDLQKIKMPSSLDAHYYYDHPDSIMNKNSFINVGIGGYLSPEESFIAMPRMQSKFLGDDIVKSDFHSQINKLQRQRSEIMDTLKDNQVKGLDANEAVLKKIDNYKKTVQKTKELIAKTITSKESVLKDVTEVRLNDSVVGKASGVVVTVSENMKKLASASDATDYEKRFASKYEKLISGLGGYKNINLKALSEAEFKGKSILEHYEKGNYINAEFLSKDVFRELGYFEKDKLAEYGFKTEEEMANALKKYGTMGLSSRSPIIHESSIASTMAYLSDDMHGMRFGITSEAQLAKAGDYDGDNANFAAIKTKEGLDYLKYKLMPEKAKGKSALEFKNIESDLMFRGVGINKYYRAGILKDLRKNLNSSISEDINSVTSDWALGSTLFGTLKERPTNEKIIEQAAIYKQLESEAITELNRQGKEGASAIDFERKDLVSGIDTVLESYRDSDKEKFNKYYDAALFNERLARHDRAMIAKNLKPSIGAVNIPLYNLRKASELFLVESSQESTYKRYLLQHFAATAEQGVISSKHDRFSEIVLRTKEFGEAFKDVLENKNSQKMVSWFDTYFKKPQIDKITDINEMIENSGVARQVVESKFKGLDKEQTYKTLVSDFVSTLKDFDATKIAALKESNKLADSRMGVLNEYIGKALKEFPVDDSTTVGTYINSLKERGLLEESFKDRSFFQEGIKRLEPDLELIDGREYLHGASGNAKQEIKSILQFAGEGFKSIKGQNLAWGALGLAGAFLVAGFVGGNPSRPAETQAWEDSNEQSYDVPNLQDQNLQQVQQSKQQGYVINVKGQTNKNNSRLAYDMSNSANSSIATNLNIFMNINEDHGNINDRYIDKLLERAI